MTDQQPDDTGSTANPQQPVPDTVYISFSAEINIKTTETLLAVLTEQVRKGVPNVYLLLSTPGGEVSAGFTIYNMMRALPINFVTHNVGNVDSIGNIIFLAGDKRYACPQSSFMFHGVGFNTVAGAHFEEKILSEKLDSIVADHDRIASILVERTNLDSEAAKELFREAQTKDPGYAKTNGIIDDIRNPEIPAGAAIMQLVFQR